MIDDDGVEVSSCAKDLLKDHEDRLLMVRML